MYHFEACINKVNIDHLFIQSIECHTPSRKNTAGKVVEKEISSKTQNLINNFNPEWGGHVNFEIIMSNWIILSTDHSLDNCKAQLNFGRIHDPVHGLIHQNIRFSRCSLFSDRNNSESMVWNLFPVTLICEVMVFVALLKLFPYIYKMNTSLLEDTLASLVLKTVH